MLKYVTWVEIMDDNFIRIKSKLKLVELVVAERCGNTPSDPTAYCVFNKKNDSSRSQLKSYCQVSKYIPGLLFVFIIIASTI